MTLSYLSMDCISVFSYRRMMKGPFPAAGSSLFPESFEEVSSSKKLGLPFANYINNVTIYTSIILISNINVLPAFWKISSSFA